MNPKVDFYFNTAERWQKELKLLRLLALDTGLSEELKWGVPCYTLEKKNVVLIHVFKEYCAFLFFKGVLLQDPKGILIQQTENVQAARQVRLTNVNQIVKLKAILKAYLKEAIDIEKSGSKPVLKTHTEMSYPEELQKVLNVNPDFKTAFNALTPGRQKAYNLYFTAPIQSKTRTSRVEKFVPQILNGKGLNDE